MHFCTKRASPTASASSMTRMSASTCAMTANASRTAMPVEYVLIGCSMNSPMSANAQIASKRASISLLRQAEDRARS